MDARRGTPVIHPLAHPVTMLTTEQSGRNDGHLRPLWEATVRGPSPDVLPSAPGTTRRTP